MVDRGTQAFDVIVVGLGAMGAATLHRARQEGLQVLGIDRHRPPHTFGSTHAETRITRLAVGEGAPYLPFVRRSHEIWREIQAASGATLLHECGGLIITEQEPVAGQRWQDFVTQTSEIAASAGIEYHVLDAAEAQRKCPVLEGFDGKRIGFEPTAGLVMAEDAVAAQLALADRHGAVVNTAETVVAIEPDRTGVDVVSDPGRYRADHGVLAAGPWLPDLVDRADAARLRVTRQVVYWFEVDDVDAYRVDELPFVMWVGDTDADYLGVFPIVPGGTQALKVLGEQFVDATDPETVDRSVDDHEIDAFYERHVRTKLPGVSRRCVKSEVCLYTNTVDDHFLIDHDRRSDRIVIMSACSGHGFKHSAALGEAVAQQIACGSSTLDLSPFRRR